MKYEMPMIVGLLTLSWSMPLQAVPKMLCYSVHPNAYIDDHASEMAELYDGFYFPIGGWDTGTENVLGIKGQPAHNPNWIMSARRNIAALKEAGATENFLTVSFGSSGDWPSPSTLLSETFTEKFASHFTAIGHSAQELGFRGVCIDVEYPYPRYQLDHEIYTYKGYTAEDLVTAAYKQGRVCMEALLDQFPEAPIIVLPGHLRVRPISRAYQMGLLEVMAERDAPGGFHVGTEFTYGLQDPVTIAATARFEDPAIKLLSNNPRTWSYWKKRCTMAPGVWPLHMVETGSKFYPARPWKEEVAELREEVAILRTVAKRYIWSYTGNPVWYIYSPELKKKYGLRKQNLKREDIDLHDWHATLKETTPPKTPGLKKLFKKIRSFDRGDLSSKELCDAFGTPGRWWVLGMLSNPHTEPTFAAANAIFEPIYLNTLHFGRDEVVRWFAFDNLDPRGIINCRFIFDYFHTNAASAQFVTFIESKRSHRAILHTGWDDGIIIRLGNKVVFDKRDYPVRGRGMLYQDHTVFEKHIPITIPNGRTRLSIVSLNSHGNWVFSLRITAENGIPFDDVRFRLE